MIFRAALVAVAVAVAAPILGTALPSAVAGMPRVMVMVDEKNLGAYTTAESEKVITQHLLSQGLDIVDAEMVRTSTDREKSSRE